MEQTPTHERNIAQIDRILATTAAATAEIVDFTAITEQQGSTTDEVHKTLKPPEAEIQSTLEKGLNLLFEFDPDNIYDGVLTEATGKLPQFTDQDLSKFNSAMAEVIASIEKHLSETPDLPDSLKLSLFKFLVRAKTESKIINDKLKINNVAYLTMYPGSIFGLMMRHDAEQSHYINFLQDFPRYLKEIQELLEQDKKSIHPHLKEYSQARIRGMRMLAKDLAKTLPEEEYPRQHAEIQAAITELETFVNNLEVTAEDDNSGFQIGAEGVKEIIATIGGLGNFDLEQLKANAEAERAELIEKLEQSPAEDLHYGNIEPPQDFYQHAKNLLNRIIAYFKDNPNFIPIADGLENFDIGKFSSEILFGIRHPNAFNPGKPPYAEILIDLARLKTDTGLKPEGSDENLIVVLTHEVLGHLNSLLLINQNPDLNIRIGHQNALGTLEAIAQDAEELGEITGLYKALCAELGLSETAISNRLIHGRLLRIGRLQIHIGLHDGTYKYNTAIEHLVESCKVDRSEAEKEVQRAIRQPGSTASYYPGLLALRKLRNELTGTNREKFKEFYQALLLDCGPGTPWEVVEPYIRHKLQQHS